MARILSDTYRLLLGDGRSGTNNDVHRGVTRLFHSNVEAWTGMRLAVRDRQTQVQCRDLLAILRETPRCLA